MAERVRAYDWSKTALGPLESWSKEFLAPANLVLSSPFPSVLWLGPELVMLYNDPYRILMGERHPGALGQIARVVWQEAWHILGPQVEAIYTEGKPAYQENLLIPILTNGRMQDRYWRYSLSPIYENGQIAGILNTAHETTEAVMAERQRRSLAEQLDQVLEATTDSILSIDRNWKVTYLNPHARETAAPSGEILGRNFWECFPDAVYEGSPFIKNYNRAMYDRIAGEFEAFYPEPLNIWVHVQVRPAADGIVLFFRDVTEQRRKEEAQRENETKLKLATEAAEIGVWVWHVGESRGTWENDRMYEIFGRTREDGMVDSAEFATQVLHPEDAGAYGRAVARALTAGTPYRFEGRFYRKDGSLGWLELKGQLEYDANGAPWRMLGMAIDITARRKAEEALRQTEKLAAVGRLAASIAHEINNPLESVTNLLYLARTSDDLEQVQRYLDTAEQELRRVSLISNQTLRFHKQATKPQEIGCADLFAGVLSVYEGRLKNSKVLIEKRKRACKPVLCFEGEIRQVLSNLVGNAIDALQPQGGRLLIRSREATDWATGRKGLVLTVADTGRGISAHMVRKIFEPFFTTKGIGGTGLGLWISQEIVARHQGALRVRSSQREGRSGTVFNLFLPFEAAAR